MHDRIYSAPTGSADIRALKLLIPYILNHPKRVKIALLFLILAKVANVLVPLLLKYIVDRLESLQSLTEAEALMLVPIGLIVSYGIFRFSAVLFGELRDAVFSRVSESTLSAIGVKVLSHLHSLDLEYHLSRKTGGLSRDIERGTNSISFLLRAIVFSVIPILLEVTLVTVILLVTFNLSIATIAVCSIVAYIIFSVIVTNWRTRFVRKANQIDSQANTRAIDSLLNFETVKYFNNEAYEAKLYTEQLKLREEAKIKNHMSLAALNCGQVAIISVGMTVMLWLAAKDVAVNALTLGDLVMLNAYMIQVFIPLNMMGMIYREMKRSLADFEAMYNILDIEPQIKDNPDAKPLSPGEHAIEFDQVNFSYHEARPILKQLSFTLPARHKIAIVGASGAGKSTIARLIYRFYQPQNGDIRIGGQPLEQITLDSLRRAIGVVPQDTVLFNDTLYNNLLYGRPTATREEIEEAVHLAHLESFIASLPKGYETRVGERGLKVSGGEKQRIAIARAILKQPDILVFDEATSSLDSESEQAIMTAFEELASRHTTLMIAHRLSTIRGADKILVMDQGQLVEEGTHSELLALNGVYHKLWTLQHSDKH